ncbi:hypothetical protein OG589_30810 [Sphaerisporangium sp. NBC_01403]|uniref:hypothetical protein n=1 Tax=Sphaerisporangium sp. NBC_01403 TaxID=2903599 RepID=UPI003251E49C
MCTCTSFGAGGSFHGRRSLRVRPRLITQEPWAAQGTAITQAFLIGRDVFGTLGAPDSVIACESRLPRGCFVAEGSRSINPESHDAKGRFVVPRSAVGDEPTITDGCVVTYEPVTIPRVSPTPTEAPAVPETVSALIIPEAVCGPAAPEAVIRDTAVPEAVGGDPVIPEAVGGPLFPEAVGNSIVREAPSVAESRITRGRFITESPLTISPNSPVLIGGPRVAETTLTPEPQAIRGCRITRSPLRINPEPKVIIGDSVVEMAASAAESQVTQ